MIARFSRLAPILAALLLTATIALPAVADPAIEKADPSALTAAQQGNVKVLDGVLSAIQRQFYDRDFSGLKLEDLRARYLDKVLAVKPKTPLYGVLNEMLGEFKVSHLALVEPEVYALYFEPEFTNGVTLRPGFEIARLGDEYFVASLHQGGAAETAGLLRGDRIVRINGLEAARSPMLVDGGSDPGIPGAPHYVICCPIEAPERTLTLEIQRKRGDKELTTVKIEPALGSLIESTRNSVAVIEKDGRKLGYIRIWHVLHEEIARILSFAIRKKFADCDGMILDLRGRGGNIAVMNAVLEPFGEAPPQPDRRGRMRRQVTGMPKWTKPVVGLIDSGSRSAKEVIAHNWKYLEVGPLVGETTAGAVLASNFARMPDGSQLLLPVSAVQNLAYGNVKLEGNGVKPTHPIADIVAYAQGGDIIKETGIKVLLEKVKAVKTDKPAPLQPEVPDEPATEEQFSR